MTAEPVVERKERWLPVPDAPGYVVSDKGRLWSRDRYITEHSGRLHHVQGRALKATLRNGIHLAVHLCVDGVKQNRYVHEIVLTTWAGPCPDGFEALHGERGPLWNWFPEDLHYGPRSENMLDRHRDGAFTQAKLTAEIVIAARQRHYGSGETFSGLAREFNVSKGAMRKAVTGITWSHLSEPTPAAISPDPIPPVPVEAEQGALFELDAIGGDPSA